MSVLKCIYLSKILYRSCDDCPNSSVSFKNMNNILSCSNIDKVEILKCFGLYNASFIEESLKLYQSKFTYTTCICSLKSK